MFSIATPILKERFCKDLNLPIRVFESPYFEDRIALFDKQFKCLDKYRDFCILVEKYGGEQPYLEHYHNVKDSAIRYLNENSAMQRFMNEGDFSQYKVQHTGFIRSDIYTITNHGKCFISLDMRKGNFTALRHFDPEIVGGKDTYEEFFGMFTTEPHLIQSKYIRQVVFGNCNPKRQTKYEQFLMDKVLGSVLTYIAPQNIAYFSTDEIVININRSDIEKYRPMIAKTVADSIADGINIRAEFFTLYKIEGIADSYIKKDLDSDAISIKGVNNIMMPFVLRALYNQMPTEYDKVFVYEGKLAKLMDNPHIIIPDMNSHPIERDGSLHIMDILEHEDEDR